MAYQHPYIEKGKPVLKPSFCAFLDILGFNFQTRSAAKQGQSDVFFQKLVDAIKSSNKNLKPFFSGPKLSSHHHFSDCLVLGFPISRGELDDTEGEFGAVLAAVSEHQIEMTLSGFFVRGGLSFGELHVGSNLVFGSALLESYELESKVALNPRIVLSNSAKKQIISQLIHYGRVSESPHSSAILIDKKGTFFINYLDWLYQEPGVINWPSLLNHKKVVQKFLNKYKKNLKIYRKYLWVAHYHNFFCKSFALTAKLEELMIAKQPATKTIARKKIAKYLIPLQKTRAPKFYFLSDKYDAEKMRVKHRKRKAQQASRI